MLPECGAALARHSTLLWVRARELQSVSATLRPANRVFEINHTKRLPNVAGVYPPTGSRLRRPSARYLVVLVAVSMFALWLFIHIGGVTVTTWVDDLGELGAAVAGAIACAVAARRLSGRDRRSWALIAASCATWAACELAWCWYELIQNTPTPFPSLADVGFLGAVPLMIAGLLGFPQLIRGAAARMQTGVDGLIIATALLVISWSTLLSAIYSGGSDSPLGMVLSLAYPISDIAIVTMALLLATRARASTRTPLLLLAAGVTASALADSSFAYFTATGSFASGTPLDSAWVAAFLLIALAGMQAGTSAGSSAARAPLPSRLRVAAPYLPVAIAAAVAIWRITAQHGIDTFLLVSIITLIALVVVRQSLALFEGAGLLHTLSHDGLTGLPNRDLLRRRINDALNTAQGDCTLLLIELAEFNEIIDRLGRTAGDRILVITGRRLQMGLRAGDLAAHLAGEQFGVLLDDGTSLDDAVSIGRRLLKSLEEPIEVDARPVRVRGRIGLVSGGHGAHEAHEMLRRAEIAVSMGDATEDNALVVYTSGLEAALDEQVRWRAELEAALSADQFVVHYQPIVEVATQRIVGVEALVRWQHGRLGLLAPGRFIADLERTGLIVDVGAWVLKDACRTVQQWRTQLGVPLYLTVNASSVQLQRLEFETAVRAALANSGLPADALVIELTESGLIEGAGAAQTQLRSVRSDGVRLALDDFGTGYSSLTYLQQFDVDLLKIDKSFVDQVTVTSSQPLVKVLLDLGAALGLATVAEGVESQEQHEALHAMGCRFAQGYLYSRPVAAADLELLLHGNRVAAA